MPSVYRVSAIWAGFAGAPGYTRFAFQSLTTDAERNAAGLAMRTFFDALKAYIPAGTTIQVQNVVDEFNQVSGELIGSAVMTTSPTLVTSTAAAGTYAGGSGCVVTWSTSLVFHGHRVKGRTFIVPLIGTLYANDGTLLDTLPGQIQTAGNALIAASADFAVWSRWYGSPPGKVQLDGAVASVTACSVKDSAAQLRSRRL